MGCVFSAERFNRPVSSSAHAVYNLPPPPRYLNEDWKPPPHTHVPLALSRPPQYTGSTTTYVKTYYADNSSWWRPVSTLHNYR